VAAKQDGKQDKLGFSWIFRVIDELKLQKDGGTAPENWFAFNLRVESLVS
jgi:hypothetical protein